MLVLLNLMEETLEDLLKLPLRLAVVLWTSFKVSSTVRAPERDKVGWIQGPERSLHLCTYVIGCPSWSAHGKRRVQLGQRERSAQETYFSQPRGIRCLRHSGVLTHVAFSAANCVRLRVS